MIVPPERLNNQHRQDWQRKALENIFIHDAYGSSTFATIDSMGWMQHHPQHQDYQRVIPITILAPEREEEAVALMRALVPRAKRWEADKITKELIEPLREHFRKQRGSEFAFTPTAEEQKRIYQVFSEMNQIPEISSHLVEDGYRVFVGGGITTARLFNHSIPHKAEGAFDPRTPRAIFIGGMVTYDEKELSQVVFEEFGHAYHHLALYDDPVLKGQARDFTYYFFSEQVDKLQRAKAMLETMALKIGINRVGTPEEVTARWSNEESAVIDELRRVAKRANATPHEVVRAAIKNITNVLHATDEICLESDNENQMNELTTKSLVEVINNRRNFGSDLRFLIDIGGRVEGYDAGAHNAQMSLNRYNSTYNETQRHDAQRFGEQIQGMLSGSRRRTCPD